MSYFLFGECILNNALRNKKELLETLQFTFDEKIDFFDGIHQMINENSILNKMERHIFCITSKLQMKNSDDVLFPYDKFSQQLLFDEDGEGNEFIKICCKNLSLLENGLKRFIEIYSPEKLRFYITEGYDCNFKVVEVTIEEFIRDVQKQILNDFFIDSKIYNINKS